MASTFKLFKVLWLSSVFFHLGCDELRSVKKFRHIVFIYSDKTFSSLIIMTSTFYFQESGLSPPGWRRFFTSFFMMVVLMAGCCLGYFVERNNRAFRDCGRTWEEAQSLLRLNASAWISVSKNFCHYPLALVILNWRFFFFFFLV